MKLFHKFLKTILVAAAALAGFAPLPLLACASGMNWGIFTLMGVIVTVLATIAGFFVYIVRKEAAMTNNPAPKNPTEVEV